MKHKNSCKKNNFIWLCSSP